MNQIGENQEATLDRRGFLAIAGAACAASTLAAESGKEGKGKRIGLIDYKLDNFHANVYLRAVRHELKDRGFSIVGGWALQEGPSRAWAKKNDVAYFSSVEKLGEACDAVMVLAPSNPEKHLELCQKAIGLGKPLYVDKTFAPDLATAQKIFQLADTAKIPLQTTSALRYTNVQASLGKEGRSSVKHMVAWGPGGSFAEYAIHPVELVVSCMGPGAQSLMRRGDEPFSQLLVGFSEGRTAVINVYTQTDTPFATSITTEKRTRHIVVDSSRIFIATAAAILDFFESGRPNIDRQESLAVMRILDAARDPRAKEGFISL